jgi:hypothetical protein
MTAAAGVSADATAHYFDDRDPPTGTEAWQDWPGGLAA